MRTIMICTCLIFLLGCSNSPLETEVPPMLDTGVDSSSWALVPAGEFLLGQFSHEANLPYDYEIMVTDVTNEQFAAYLNLALASDSITIEDNQVVGFYPGDEFHGYRHEEEIAAGDWIHMPLDDPSLRIEFSDGHFSVLEGYENHPVVMITWFGANAYCEYYDGRLPSEIEWEKAARGTDGRPFPWGHEIDKENANFYSSHDPFEDYYGKSGDTTPVGFYSGLTFEGYSTEDSASPFGLYDMAGNVEQWTGDVYENQHYRYLRGGSKMSYEYDLRIWSNNNVRPDYYSPSIGFRCAQGP